MAQAAATKFGIPDVSVFLAPDLIHTQTRAPTGVPNFALLRAFGWWAAGKGVNSLFGDGPKRVHAQLGLAKPGPVLSQVWPSKHLNLIAVSPTLFERPSDWADSTIMTGFWRGPLSEMALDPKIDAFLNMGEPPVYATFGSLFPDLDPLDSRRAETLSLLRDAARLAGKRLILQRHGELEQVDDRLLTVPRSPHATVFPRCEAVIHHGGAGTTQTALRSGTPAVIVPHVADQFFWAAQLKSLGVAIEAPTRRKITAVKLGQAITRACDDRAMAETAKTLGAAMENDEGLAGAVRAIEGFLAKR